MPKSDTWPGSTAIEPLSNMDSAGSCDSVISINSAFSEDSLEHLSADERACLMYLEKTIDSLQMEDDSGLSNDEPDSHRSAAEMAQISQNRVEAVYEHDDSGHNQRSFLSCGVPTPLLLANRVASLPPSVSEDFDNPRAQNSEEPKSAEAEPAMTALPVNSKAEQLAASNDSDAPALTTNTECLDTFQTQVQVLASNTESSPIQTETEGDNNLSAPAGTSGSSEIDLGLIPPPSDFMDEPGPQTQPEVMVEMPLSVDTSGRSPNIHLEDILMKASIKETPPSSPLNHDLSSKSAFKVPGSPSAPDSPSVASPNPLPEASEPRSPPAVAPKPKKLPSNIVLKSHRTSFGVSDGNFGHSVASASDRLLSNPQRVRMEALKKLGLLKSDEMDSSPALSPNLSPKSRMSWAAPPSPISPAAPQTPTPPSIPFPVSTSAPPVTSVTIFPPATSTDLIADQGPELFPAPAAFSDPIEPPTILISGETSLKTQNDSPPSTSDIAPKLLTSPNLVGVKPATLERSDLGLSSFMVGQESSEVGRGANTDQILGELRNSRPRPASLGSGQDFSSVKGAGLQPGQSTCKDSESRRSNPTFTVPQATGDSPKLPGSHGVSVLICPRAENEENRREALKKLGLFRD